MNVQDLRALALGRLRGVLAAAVAACALAACSNAPTLPPAEQPLSKETLSLLGRKGMDLSAPIFIRIFKEESELEVWKQRADGRYYHFKTYPICNWSGDLGPKVTQGDKQAPEGFYKVARGQMNPNSQFHLAFNLGYPNAYDRSLGRTGDFVMVHGKCKSAGCYAMTDALIEEIYALVREAIAGGQDSFQVHAFPFRPTEAKLAQHKSNQWHGFWQVLRQGYDHFEATRVPPNIAVCERRYVVNVKMPATPVAADGFCPHFERPAVTPFIPADAKQQQVADERITVRGPKLRTADSTSAAMTVPGAPQSSAPVAGANAAKPDKLGAADKAATATNSKASMSLGLPPQ